MATDNMVLAQQMEELSRGLKVVTSALTDLSSQLRSLERVVGQAFDQFTNKDVASSSPASIADEQPQRTSGYVNWNSTHNILRTENWMKLSLFIEFCGKLERGVIVHFDTYINMDEKKIVDEETRFPEDDLYVNVSSPLVRSEILYIKETIETAKKTRKPVAVGLVARFLNVAKDEMHSVSSFEKKYGLKWVIPLPNTKNVIEAMPIPGIPDSNSSNVEKPIEHAVVPDLWCLEDTNLDKVNSTTTPTTSKDDDFLHEKLVTQELSKKYAKLLNQLTLLNMGTVLKKVMTLPVDNQARLEVLVDLLFEKSLENPSSSLVYAKLASKLSTVVVPSDSDPNSNVTFRALLIQKCQDNFEAERSDEQLKLEIELTKTDDSDIKTELQMKIDQINKLARNRAVANSKLIGELYKVKMLTWKIVDYCLTKLKNSLEDDKIECLCELLITAGEKLENEALEKLNEIFAQMQDTIDFKSDEISRSALYMIQDVIDLRNRKWVKGFKSMANVLPKTLNEIQEDSEKRALLIELMNTFDVSVNNGSNDDSALCVRRKELSSSKKVTGDNLYTVDFLKLEATSKATQNYIKIPPKIFEDLSKSEYSVLEKFQADPTSRTDTLTANLDVIPTAGAVKTDYHSISKLQAVESILTPIGSQVPITDLKMKRAVKSTVDQFLINTDSEELVADVKQLFPPQYHSAVINQVVSIALKKTFKEVKIITNLTLHLVATNTITPKNFASGLKATFKFAPDLLIDVPKIYDYLGNILAPHIEKDHITFARILAISKSIISADQGHLLLESIIDCLYENMGYESVRSKWEESGLQLSQWMKKELVAEWIEGNNFEFLEDGYL